MRIDIGAACRDALAIWRRDRDIMVAVAGMFFFLPNLLLELLVFPAARVAQRGADDQAALDTVMRFVGDNIHWLALQSLAELAGVATLLALLLDPSRPTVGAALGSVARRLPVLVAAAVLVNIAVFAGLLLLLLPGLYVIGRAAMVLPVLMAEPERRFGDACAQAVTLTAGRVAQLLAIWGLIFFGSQLIQIVLNGTARAASFGGGNPVTAAMLATAMAAVAAGTVLAFTLVRATIYVRLTSKG